MNAIFRLVDVFTKMFGHLICLTTLFCKNKLYTPKEGTKDSKTNTIVFVDRKGNLGNDSEGFPHYNRTG